jgi:hypothetical protein
VIKILLMAKRRTRKDKERAHHSFLYSWQPEPGKAQSRHDVKGQFVSSLEDTSSKAKHAKSANKLAKDDSLASIKHDIVKSLILASFILGAELVVYLAWF